MVCGEATAVVPLVNELAITAGAVPSPALRAAVTRARAVLGPAPGSPKSSSSRRARRPRLVGRCWPGEAVWPTGRGCGTVRG